MLQQSHIIKHCLRPDKENKQNLSYLYQQTVCP